MSLSTFSFSGKRRLIVIIAAVATLVAVVASVAFMALHAKTALGSGTGPGSGICAPTSPVCTENGNSAFISFDNVSSDGCIDTQVYVQPTSSLSHPGSNASQSVFVSIYKFDQCNGIQVEAGGNYNPLTGSDPEFTGTIEFGSNLSTGSVSGTAPIYDGMTGDLLYTATINVTWQGYGPTTRNLESDHFFSSYMVMNLHINGTSRSAQASGTFTDETGANAITEPTLNAVIFNSTGSQVIITKP